MEGHTLVHAQVPYDLHAKVKAVALTEDRTLSQVVRRALSAYVNEQRRDENTAVAA